MRIFQIIVILFWLGSVGWLAKTMLTPDEAGMEEVDHRRPLNSVFKSNDTSRLFLYQNGRKIGEIQTVGFAFDDNSQDLPGFSISVVLNGDVSVPIMGTFCRVLVKFEQDSTLHSGNLLFRMPSNQLKVQIGSRGNGSVTSALVSLNKNTLFAFDKNSDAEAFMPAIKAMAKTNPLTSDLLSKAGDPNDWTLESECYRGIHKFAGRRIPIYLVKLSSPQTDQTIRIYISESGEPLKIETDLGFEAISEVLVPVQEL